MVAVVVAPRAPASTQGSAVTVRHRLHPRIR